ncbi:MAG: hypothetical protein EOP06_02950 [Proteobacteria bacterium]|nr:MAG: hypothetical protein EOP06_02950 [Pseudomonadota bacterium]
MKRLAKNVILSILYSAAFVVSSNAYSRESCEALFSEVGRSDSSRLHTAAKGLGLDVVHLDFAYRFDSREPEEILRSGGFHPNPNKASGDLEAHVKRNSDGTGSFVSLTSEGKNLALLRAGFLIEHRRVNELPSPRAEAEFRRFYELHEIEKSKAQLEVIKSDFEKLYGSMERPDWSRRVEAPGYQRLSPQQKAVFEKLYTDWYNVDSKIRLMEAGFKSPLVIEFIQYEVRNVSGIDIGSAGISSEREIVTDAVPVSAIRRYRKINMIFYGGTWEGLQSQGHRAYVFEFQQAHLNPETAPQMLYGPWISMGRDAN